MVDRDHRSDGFIIRHASLQEGSKLRSPGSQAQEWDWRALHRLALREARRILDPDLAQDAAQEAVTRAWRHADRLRGSAPEPWLRTIARREALRLAAGRSCGPLPDDWDPATETCEADDVDDRLDVARALRQLSVPERRGLVLRYWADMTSQDVADRSAEPLGTVKVRQHRALAKLARPLSHGRAT